jgi:hypothetical protein
MHIRGNGRKNKIARKPRSRWVDSTEMNLRETRWRGVNWIHLSQDRDQLGALVKQNNLPWVPLNIKKILMQLWNWRLLKESSAPWS